MFGVIRQLMLLVVVPFTGLTGCALEPVAVRVKYLPQESEFEAVPACARYQSIGFDDLSSGGAVIGKRHDEFNPAERVDISVSNNKLEVLAQATKRAFGIAALTRDDRSKAVLKVSFAQLELDEATNVTSVFRANLVIDAQIFDSTTQKVVWDTRKSGQSKNFGRAGSEENYQETLSRALDAALAKLLADPAFSAALCRATARST